MILQTKNMKKYLDYSICDFPDSVKENDSFDFIIDNDKKINCVQFVMLTHQLLKNQLVLLF